MHHTDAEREYAYDTDPILGAGTGAVLRLPRREAATGP